LVSIGAAFALDNPSKRTSPGGDCCLIFQQPSLYPWLAAPDDLGFALRL
jgi:ABC-type taurine transport system ATPase subunit